MINKLQNIKYFVVDVDGTMTDTGIYYDCNGNELKKFSTRDAAGIIAAHLVGIKIIVVTGRECKATTRRMKELKIDEIYQGVKDKKGFIEKFLIDNRLTSENLGYIGDDLNDYAAMKLAGFKACPADSCEEVISISDYHSKVDGGRGVIQDVFRYVLHELRQWDSYKENVIEAGY